MSRPLSFDIGGTRTEVRFVPSIGRAAVAGEIPGAFVPVFDTTTRRLFGSGFDGAVVLPAGERAKQWGSVRRILSRCAERPLGRDGWLAGIGGGVVCDVAGFAASLYMRGCRLALAPTTLLAMVDASLGGKTGIDFRGWKNLVGTFHPASVVLVCVAALGTLPERELRSGLAEAIKTAIIGDPGLLDMLERRRDAVLGREPAVLEEIVRRSLRVKGAVAAADPREQARRAVLNLGHTFGHALESAVGLGRLAHGEAVAWGTVKAADLGMLLGVTEAQFAARLRGLFSAYGFDVAAPAGRDRLDAALARDKKRVGGRMRFVVPRAPGDVTVEEVDERTIARLLAKEGAP